MWASIISRPPSWLYDYAATCTCEAGALPVLLQSILRLWRCGAPPKHTDTVSDIPQAYSQASMRRPMAALRTPASVVVAAAAPAAPFLSAAALRCCVTTTVRGWILL
jgi:hypothetical protein